VSAAKRWQETPIMVKLISRFVVLGVLSTVAGCAADQASAEDTSQASDSQALLAGNQLSPSEVADLLRNAGFPESEIGPMVCTAKYESAFFDRAEGHNKNGSVDYGLFQINSVHLTDMSCASSASELFDTTTNTACAYEVWSRQGRNAWYGYQHHRSTCQHYPAPR
jgi:hypothetical protein